MIQLDFSGWFQCRLATDPDPHDERRGVSGYVHAYGGEPDLDRVLHWQAPPFVRVEGPAVGVQVRVVTLDGAEDPHHPFVGGSVQLLDEARFEGRNGVIADDGEEPIYPFHLRVSATTGAIIQRRITPADPDFPYREFFASGVEGGPQVAAEIADATGVRDLRQAWEERLRALQRHLDNARHADRVGLEERLAMLSRWVATPASPARFFGVRMRYDYALRSSPVIKGWSAELGPEPNRSAEWRVKFWLGGWDADALCGFCKGSLEIATDNESEPDAGGARTDDRAMLLSG